MAAASVLNNIFSSWFDYQSVKATEQYKTVRAEIYADFTGNVVQTFYLLANEYANYRQVVEQEKTRRKEIEAFEKEAIARIEAQKEALITYLNRSFDERDKNFAALFNVVDRALETGNNEQLAMALMSITELANSSPLDRLAKYSDFQAKLDDPNYKWQF